MTDSDSDDFIESSKGVIPRRITRDVSLSIPTGHVLGNFALEPDDFMFDIQLIVSGPTLPLSTASTKFSR